MEFVIGWILAIQLFGMYEIIHNNNINLMEWIKKNATESHRKNYAAFWTFVEVLCSDPPFRLFPEMNESIVVIEKWAVPKMWENSFAVVYLMSQILRRNDA